LLSDDQHFEVRVVESRERIERLDEHRRRLVVGRTWIETFGARAPWLNTGAPSRRRYSTQ